MASSLSEHLFALCHWNTNICSLSSREGERLFVDVLNVSVRCDRLPTRDFVPEEEAVDPGPGGRRGVPASEVAQPPRNEQMFAFAGLRRYLGPSRTDVRPREGPGGTAGASTTT